ncbi:hypothetical protein NQ315_016063 [Exocentrus adspersus]|uniref:Uncharacterized protein n=1 Tax=Exocentrus adspersus TaxID=1586481 RepID=A0AAV8VLA6_9CUCU|nr:hypothetical protein NQ315_016063 [Exocentrus adspersus]
MFRTNSPGIFSSQYLRNEDDPYEAGYEITDPGTPMMVKANDGWYSQNRSLIGSRLSLYSNKNVKYLTEQASAGVSQKPSYNNLTDDVVKEFKKRDRKVSQSRPVIREEIEDFRNGTSNSYERVHCMHSTQECVNEKEVLTDAAKRLELYKQQHGEKGEMSQITEEFENKSDISLLKKISIFFDFDLFNDFTYVNLMLGITIANFAELNFSILTPIVLKEFMFEKYEIATFMSLLGAMDIVIRFFIPFMADKIGWSNRVFFFNRCNEYGIWKNK